MLNPNITRTFVFSASRITTIEACFWRANARYNLKLYPVETWEPLERGTLIAKLTEEFYKSKLKGLDFNESLNAALEVGRFVATKLSIKIEASEYIIERFIQYLHHYLNDDWIVLGVEEPFTKVLYESEQDNLRLVGEGKIDLIISHKQNVVVVDTKSSAREADLRKINAQKLDNQFKMYCRVFDIHQICINDIGVQKTKNEDALFKRRILNFSQAILDEWLENKIYWATSWLEHNEAGLFPRNFSSCYGCDYNRVCSEEPDMRQYILNRDFKYVAGNYDIYSDKKEEIKG